jgi:enoyl-CoA hydratase/carnithine racemase
MSLEVSLKKMGHVARITFAKPPFNYACPALLRGIADALDEIDGDPEIRCSVLSSEGKNFCAGADLAGDESIVGEDGMGAIGQLYVQAERLLRRRKPMVAAVQGGAIGAGLGLAMTADFRVASPSARFSSNFVRLGFHPGFALTCTLPKVIGGQKARGMSLSAARVKPADAFAWGLADRLAEDEAGLLDAAHEMAGTIAENAPLALVAVRSTIVGTLADEAVAAMRHEHEQQTLLKVTDDYREGVASVFERRDAHFTGR